MSELSNSSTSSLLMTGSKIGIQLAQKSTWWRKHLIFFARQTRLWICQSDSGSRFVGSVPMFLGLPDSHPDPLDNDMDPRIRIRTKCHGSPTNTAKNHNKTWYLITVKKKFLPTPVLHSPASLTGSFLAAASVGKNLLKTVPHLPRFVASTGCGTIHNSTDERKGMLLYLTKLSF